MPTCQSNTPCLICGQLHSIMNSHHTIPRARGGEDSEQIILCCTCHDILHAQAYYIVSKLRNPNRKKENKQFWRDVDHERRATPFVRLLVESFSAPASSSQDHLVSTKLNDELFEKFKLLVKDLGCNQDQTIEYCIRYTLTKRGFLNEKTAPSQMWFLPVSGTRKGV